ncbi:hypothetical protein ID866_9921, partial [Astraeus odoratus]
MMEREKPSPPTGDHFAISHVPYRVLTTDGAGWNVEQTGLGNEQAGEVLASGEDHYKQDIPKIQVIADTVENDANKEHMGDTSEMVEPDYGENAEVGPSTALNVAQIATDQAQLAPSVVQKFTDVVGDANIAMNRLDAFDSMYLQPLKAFNTVLDTIANVHPYTKMALGVLSWASQMIINQVNRDTAINQLLGKIGELYQFISEDDRLKKLVSMEGVLKAMSDQVLDCARFIANYSETKGFWKRLRKNIMAETELLCIHIAVHHILQDLEQLGDTVHLNSMSYAEGAGLNTSKQCLQGTRTEILGEIVDWIHSRDPNVPRVLWLSGQAGKGKSAIAHTVAAWVKELGGLGSCFCFARDRQAEHRHEKIFTTIARDLAGRHPMLRRSIASVIAEDPSLKSTPDVRMQWRKLILEPISHLPVSVGGTVIVVIDALDESGDNDSREHILQVVKAMEAADLLTGYRVLVTSRPLHDIHSAFHNVGHIKTLSLDDSSYTESTMPDIAHYVQTKLSQLNYTFIKTDIEQLTAMSDGLFEWARLACEFIKPRKA